MRDRDMDKRESVTSYCRVGSRRQVISGCLEEEGEIERKKSVTTIIKKLVRGKDGVVRCSTIHACGVITALSDPNAQHCCIGPLHARWRDASNGVRFGVCTFILSGYLYLNIKSG